MDGSTLISGGAGMDSLRGIEPKWRSIQSPWLIAALVSTLSVALIVLTLVGD